MQNGEKDISKRIKYIAYFKKPKVFWSFIAIAAAIVITTVCLTNPSQKIAEEVKNFAVTSEKELDYDEIYNYKTLYVGDAVKVSNLARRLYYSQYGKGISLQTYSAPYGATVNYKITRSQLSEKDGIIASDDMKKNAAIMLSLINNVDYITYNFDDGTETKKFIFSRNELERVLGKSTRDYSSSLEKFKEEFIPMIEKQDWSTLNASTYSIANNTSEKVEENLNIIEQSPASSSNPGDYIKAHRSEYETILKMGEDALIYMLSLFEQRESNGLKAHIMMNLCIDLLGSRNNVKEGSYTSPEEWYSKLSLYTTAKLPAFKYETDDEILGLTYSAALSKYSAANNAGDILNVVAPKVYGTYEKGNEFKIFATVYYSGFKLYDKTLAEVGGGIVPAAIIYTKNKDGSYTFKEYIEAKDGAYFKTSIEEFCSPRNDIAKAILKEYGNHEELFKIMQENLKNYLEKNNMKGINLKESGGKIVPLT